MRITNKFDLPECFERFDQLHAHDKGGAKYSVTEIIDSPLIPKLRALHADQLEVDISERVFSILGTAVHNILENGSPEGALTERKMYIDMCDVKISGTMDLITPLPFNKFRISDYKTVGGYALTLNQEPKKEWVEQLNSYCYIAEENGFDVTELEIIAIVRDWSARKWTRTNGYPEVPIVRIPIPNWGVEKQSEFLLERVKRHEGNSVKSATCSREERWERGTQCAVHKYNKDGSLAKRAYRVCDSIAEAHAVTLDMSGESDIVRRPGKRVRCEGNYCNVAEFCPAWQAHKNNTEDIQLHTGETK